MLFALTLCALSNIASVYAQEGVDLVDQYSELLHSPEETPSIRTNFADDEETAGEEEPGKAAFDEANELIQTLRDVTRTRPRFSKPSGFLGSGVYYLKRLFRLLFMNGPPKANKPSFEAEARLAEPLATVVTLLDEAADSGSHDAVFTIAELNFYGLYGHPRNYTRAFQEYQDLAISEGNGTAQHILGFMYATGIGGVVEKDQARALLYHTFAADAGITRAQMTVGYRHHAGIATPRNCEEAVHHYKAVADKAMHYVRSGPPGGMALPRNARRLVEDLGGAYGEGASFSSAGVNAKHKSPSSDQNADPDNIVEYLDLMSRKGDLLATFRLGLTYYEGSRSIKRDYRMAKDFFLDVARRYWTKDGKIKSDVEPNVDKWASKAAGYLGRMFLRGEGMEQNFAKAKVWFKRGVKNGDHICQYSLGLMHLQGLGMPQDPVKAAEYFGASADQDFPPAQVRLGALLMDQGDLVNAAKYFEIAARNNHIEAFYYLAEINNLGAIKERNCNMAALWYKVVSEKAESLHSSFEEANDAYDDGDTETAMLHYMMGAEQGYEAGQANVAFLLDQPSTISPLKRFLAPFSIGKRKATETISQLGDVALALIYWTRSARQMNVDSLVKMGDYYLLGKGTSEAAPDSEKAAACYQAAAESFSAQAMWNLGWMHENGIGIDQDFHLAKRYYDQSAATNKEAQAPVTAALLKLRMRSWWNNMVGGKVNSIRSEEEGIRRPRSLKEWFANFIAAEIEDLERQEVEAREAYEVGGGDGDEWETKNPADDYYDDLVEDAALLETFMIMALASALAFLVYWRQARQLRIRLQQEQALARAQAQDQQVQPVAPDADGVPEPPQQGQGMPPVPGDPAALNWVAGGIGH